MPTYRFTAAQLQSLTRRLFMAAGTPPSIADAVAEILVNANLAGHDSHGALRIPAYLGMVERGEIGWAQKGTGSRCSPASSAGWEGCSTRSAALCRALPCSY